MMIEPDGPRRRALAPPANCLVVLCHGVGANGDDLIDLADSWAPSLPHAAFAAPDGPEPCDMGPGGRQWFSLQDRTPARMEAGVAAAAQVLDGFVDAELARLGLAADRYALMGFSQGAMTALYTGLRRRVPPLAILAYSGALLAPDSVAALPGRPPVLLVHGEADGVVPVARTRLAEQTLREAGFDVTMQLSPALEHGIDQAGLDAGAAFLRRHMTAA